MLFWAVDNPAPANYLLISGDRDFSNALHQLRMRRYNILLAQPPTASAPLIAAAKSVWLWTSLLVGGPPLSNGEASFFTNSGSGTYNSTSEVPQNPNHETTHTASSHSRFIDNRNSNYVAKTQLPSELVKMNQVKKAPHEFFTVGSANSSQRPNESLQSSASVPDTSVQYRPNAPKPAFGNVRSSSSALNLPNFGKIAPSVPQFPAQKPLNTYQPNKGQSRQVYVEVRRPSSNNDGLAVADWTNPTNPSPWGTVGNPTLSNHVQGIIWIILLSLHTLKEEKIIPTEANITDCARYNHGNTKISDIDVKKALEIAVQHNVVMQHNLCQLQMYTCKNEKLWNCVNPISGNSNDYPQSTWDRIERFLSSPSERSAFCTSNCRLVHTKSFLSENLKKKIFFRKK